MEKMNLLESLYNEYKNEYKNEEIVLGDGNVNADIMLVGEAPGKDEVRLSKPFVGMAGKNLKEFLDILGITRESLYITNAIKYRLSQINPKTNRVVNRPASKEEILGSRRYLLAEIEIIKPRYIVTLGNVPLKAVINDLNASIGSVHGNIIEIDINNTLYGLYPLYHPASIIYNRNLKDVYLNDIENLKTILAP